MSDATDVESGASVFGRAAELRDSGFKEMPDPEKKKQSDTFGSDAQSLRRAAAEVSADRPKPESVERSYRNGDGAPVDEKEAVTVERAARDLSRTRDAEKEAEDEQLSLEIAEAVDRLRSDAADESETPEAAQPDKVAKPSGEPGDLDPKVKEALNHPQVRQALEEKIQEIETAKKSVTDALSAAVDLARAAFLHQFPEIAGLTAQQMPVAIAMLEKQNPERFAQLRNFLGSTAALQAQHQQEQQRLADANRKQFETYAKEEDARFDKMLGDVPAETKQAVASEILKIAEEGGVDRGEFLKMIQTEPIMRHSLFQKMMFDAAQFRMAKRAAQEMPKRPLPPVVRPGTSPERPSHGTEQLRELAAKFNAKPTAKAAAEMLAAKRRVGVR